MITGITGVEDIINHIVIVNSDLMKKGLDFIAELDLGIETPVYQQNFIEYVINNNLISKKQIKILKDEFIKTHGKDILNDLTIQSIKSKQKALKEQIDHLENNIKYLEE